MKRKKCRNGFKYLGEITFTLGRTPGPCIRTSANGSLYQVLKETGFDSVWMRGRPALSHDAEPSRPQPNSRRLDLWCVSSERATCERVRAPAGLHLVLLNLRCGFKPLQLQAFSSCNNTYRSQNNYKQLQLKAAANRPEKALEKLSPSLQWKDKNK